MQGPTGGHRRWPVSPAVGGWGEGSGEMGRGRKADGPKLVESLAGSPEAKRRCRVILDTLGGQRSACITGRAIADSVGEIP
jgi:hypothetical protein